MLPRADACVFTELIARREIVLRTVVALGVSLMLRVSDVRAQTSPLPTDAQRVVDALKADPWSQVSKTDLDVLRDACRGSTTYPAGDGPLALSPGPGKQKKVTITPIDGSHKNTAADLRQGRVVAIFTIVNTGVTGGYQYVPEGGGCFIAWKKGNEKPLYAILVPYELTAVILRKLTVCDGTQDQPLAGWHQTGRSACIPPDAKTVTVTATPAASNALLWLLQTSDDWLGCFSCLETGWCQM